MNLFVGVCVLTFVALATTETSIYPRGCIYVLGRCHRECEEGTHGYTTGCGYLTPEATCDEPHPQEDTRGHLCDYSACYCDPPTVRDTSSNKCVPVDQCPKDKSGAEVPAADDRV